MEKMELLEKMTELEEISGEMEGVADQLDALAAALTSRNGAPTKEALERALITTAKHINRLAADVETHATEILHSAGKKAAS